MKFEFENEVKVSGDPDDSLEAKEFYKSYFPWALDKIMRGDTMCSFGTTFGACNKSTNKDLQSLVNGTSWKRGYTKEVFDSIYKDKVIMFREKYHSLANFWIMPRALNTWRGKRTQGDYFDIFLNCIRNYYLDANQNSLEVINKFNEKEIKEWLDYFGEKQDGWKEFIKSNYLYAYIIGSLMEVKDIFGQNFQNENAEIVGTYHVYGKSLPQDSRGGQESKDSAIFYTENSLWAIRERAKELMIAECIV